MSLKHVILAASALSLFTAAPAALHAQESLCTKGSKVEVLVDRKWWPSIVAEDPKHGECAVTHHAYFGTENTSWVAFAKIRAPGSGATDSVPTPDASSAPAAAPAARVAAAARAVAPRPAPPATPHPHAAAPVVAAPAAKSAPAPTPAGPSQLVPTGTYVLVDGFGRIHYRTFLPGRYVYSGTPAGGRDVFGLAQARAGDPRELGSYALNGGTLVITWGGGQPAETKTFATKGADLLLDGYKYVELHRYPTGHRLDGRYVTRSYNSMGVAGGGTMAWGGTGTIVFRPDGTFDYGQSGMAATSAGNGAAASGSSKASGRYAISGNTITFTFADGSVQRAIIHPWNGEESATRPSSFNLNGHTYTRE
jgi:hypothetical protein